MLSGCDIIAENAKPPQLQQRRIIATPTDIEKLEGRISLGSQTKQILLHALSIAFKVSTALSPSTALQIFIQAGVDIGRDWLLEIPAGFPTVDNILRNSSDMVRAAVSDLTTELDIQNSPLDTTEKFVDEWLKRGNNYSEDESHQIYTAFSAYLKEIRLWAVQNPDILLDCIQTLKSVTEKQSLVLERHDDAFAEYEERISQIEGCLQKIIVGHTPKENSLNLSTFDKSKEDRFYNYFYADLSIKVDHFFLFDNYRIINLTEDSPELNKHNVDSSKHIESIDQIITIAKEQGILLITGMYGTGKTALIKKLILELAKGTDLVYYFQAKDLLPFIEELILSQTGQADNAANGKKMISVNLDEAFGSLSIQRQPVFVFIDELEELNTAFCEDEVYLNRFLSWVCAYQQKHPNYFFILASRKYAQLNEDKEICVADTLFEEYYQKNCTQRTWFTLVQTTQFSSDARREWIEEYATRNGKYTTYTEIKKSYGKITNAMKTPIFLFAFMRRYTASTISQDMVGYYFYYSKFIEETIDGRFGLGQRAGLLQDSHIKIGQFKTILRHIAFSILKKKERYLSAKIYYESIMEEYPLLADELTNHKFGIRLEELEQFMPPTEYEKASLINCYFFNMDKRRVYFTDTNILFALAAEYIYESISEIAQKNDLVFQTSHLKEIQLVRLYPHLVDYVIYLLEQDDEREYIEAYLNSFVLNPAVRCHYIDMSEQDTNVVERILLLYVLFIKTNRQSYQRKGYSHVLKEILYYVNAYKTNFYLSPGNEYAYTIERYFMKLQLHGLTLKRVNLKNYNFQGSVITDNCSFSQCNFCDTNMYHVIMDGTTFDLCNFNDVKKFWLKSPKNPQEKYQVIFRNCRIISSSFSVQSALFQNCRLENLYLDLDKNSDVNFENCFIKNLSVDVYNKLKSHIPLFRNCYFENAPSISNFTQEDIAKRIKND